MSRYFNYFPKENYTLNDNVNITDYVTNIISRYAFENKLKDNTVVFYEYQIQESDTPEIIAHKFYGNPERHWIVLMFNDIFDAQYDWPLNYNNFINFVDAKYTANGAANTPSQSGLTWAMSENNVHSYYKVITTTVADGSATGSITINKLEVDANTYSNIPTSSSVSVTTANNEYVTISTTKEKKTYYDYENEINENKRTIKLLKKEFVDPVEKEFLRVINA